MVLRKIKKNFEVCFYFWPILNLKVPKSKAGRTTAIGVVVRQNQHLFVYFSFVKNRAGALTHLLITPLWTLLI